jgi:hypothetical protein
VLGYVVAPNLASKMANKQEKSTEAGRGTNNLIFDQTHLKSTQATTKVRASIWASIWAGVVNFCEWYMQVAPGLLVVLVVNCALHAFLRDSYVLCVFWSGSLPAYGTYMCATIGTVFIMAAKLIWNTFEQCFAGINKVPSSGPGT